MPTHWKLHEDVMIEVLRDILSGRYDEASASLREVSIAQRHGVSRYIARECVQALRDRGVLRIEHGVGTTIAPRREWDVPDRVLVEAARPHGRSPRTRHHVAVRGRPDPDTSVRARAVPCDEARSQETTAPPRPSTSFPGIDERMMKAIAHPLRHRILLALSEEVSSPRRIAAYLGKPLALVAYHIRVLDQLGAVELVRTRIQRNAVEHFYKSTLGLRFCGDP